MRAPQNQLTAPATSSGVKDEDVNKYKKCWTVADRDELGEMRLSFYPGLLVSQGGATTVFAKTPYNIHDKLFSQKNN